MGAKIQWADAYIISLVEMVLVTLKNLFEKSYIVFRHSSGCEMILNPPAAILPVECFDLTHSIYSLINT